MLKLKIQISQGLGMQQCQNQLEFLNLVVLFSLYPILMIVQLLKGFTGFPTERTVTE